MEDTRFFEEKYSNLTEDFASADGFGGDVYASGQDFGNVYGEGFVSSIPTSKPLVFTVKNTTTDDITSVEILNANENFRAEDNGLASGITVTFDISGKTYSDLLGMLMSTPIEVAMTRLQSSNTTQLEATLTVETSNLFGSEHKETLFPTANEFANQNTIVIDRTNYIINQWTVITISTMYASSTVVWKIYPKAVASSIEGLKQGATKFKNPEVSGMRTLKA